MSNFDVNNGVFSGLTKEFSRYAMVGGIAFTVDFCILFLLREFFFSHNALGLYLSTACAFIVGITVNTLLSIRFVFLSASVQKKQRGRNTQDILLILLVGVIGLLLSELGMYIGTQLLLLHYLLVKCAVACTVLVWNYVGRKLWIFN